MTRHAPVERNYIDTKNPKEWFPRGKGTMRLPYVLSAAEAEDMQARSVERRQLAAARLSEAEAMYQAAKQALKNAQGAHADAVAEADELQLWGVEHRAWNPDTPVQRYFYVPDRGQPVEVTVRMDPGYSFCEVGERRPLTAAEIDSVRQLSLPDASAPDMVPLVKAAEVLAFAKALDEVEEIPDAIDNKEYQARAAENLANALDVHEAQNAREQARVEADALAQDFAVSRTASLHARIVECLSAADKGRLTLPGIRRQLVGGSWSDDMIETMLHESPSFVCSGRYWRLAVQP